jgi:ribosomal protein S18 acetylase RimI-like enzyme
MPAIEVRSAKEVDLHAVLGLFDDLNHVQSGWRVFEPRTGLRAEMQKRYRAALDDPDARLLVAVEGGEVVGMAMGYVHRPSLYSDDVALELSSFIVRPSHRRRGVGRALTRAIGIFARERGVERVTLKTFAQNEGALRFWKSVGFETRIIQMTAPAVTL